MRRKSLLVAFLTLCLAVWWNREVSAQSFPYHVSVQTVSGHCYDDAHLIFTMTDDNGNEVQIDTQSHNAVNAQYPLLSVQYHYQNAAGGSVQYDYSNDIMLMAGTYHVGVRAQVPMQGGVYAFVDTTIYNVEVTTSYNHMEAVSISDLALSSYSDPDRYGYRPSFECADLGRIQLRIIQGSFPYEVTILDEQQDTIRHSVFFHRVNTGNNPYAANFRDYYTFDSLPIGTYSIKVSDSCGYMTTMTFNIPNAEPTRYLALVRSENSDCPDETTLCFSLERRGTQEFGTKWCDYMFPYLDSILEYRFINPGNDTTGWRNIVSDNSANWCSFYDTLPNYCLIFNDTIRVQLHDLCHDTLMTYSFKFLPQFTFLDSMLTIYTCDSTIYDTCATVLQSGISTQTYKIGGNTWTGGGKTFYGEAYSIAQKVPSRYYRCPLSYDIWSFPDSTLLGHTQSNDYTGIGTWVTFNVDTSIAVHVSITDSLGCQLAEKDTVLVYQISPLDSLYYWFECHNDKDDDGKDHCCPYRYLWIQEHGVDANIFRRNMSLRLIESPLYNQFNFTAIRQDGVWNVTPEDPDNHSTYVEFTYEDGWRAIVRDSVCLAPGRYTFEVTTDCGVDTITYSWAGYYYDTLDFVAAPQYEAQQICDRVIYTQVSTGLENYMYFIDPDVSNDIPYVTLPSHVCTSYSPAGGTSTTDAQGRDILIFSVPGIYPITTYAYNWPYTNCVGWCTHYHYYYDTITVVFSYLDFETAAALLCNSSSTTGVVTAQAINGNAPYIYTLYDQGGTLIASNSSGLFEDVPMTAGQQFTVQVTDSCSTSFSINVTAMQLTHESLLWEQGPNAAQPHYEGDTVHLTAYSFPPPATYHWTGPNGFSSDSFSNDIVVLPNSESGWYTVEIYNSICGSYLTDSIFVTVAHIPQVSILATTNSVCAGDTAVLQAVLENAEQFVVPQAPPLAVGDILCTDGTTVKPAFFAASGKTAWGIVFFVDSTDEHGWAMDLHNIGGPQHAYQWSPQDYIYDDVPTLDNIVNSRDAIADFDGYSNTQKLRAAGSSTLLPAAWAVDFEHGWYLPAIGQLTQLHAQILTLNASLTLVGGTSFDLNEHYYFWSSTESANGRAWNLVYGGSPRDDYKHSFCRIRSVRNF